MRRVRSFTVYILILLVSVFMAWFTFTMGKTYINLVSHSKQISTPKQSSQEGQYTFSLSELNFWTCQVGVFQSEQNAKQEELKLKNIGWDARIVTENPWTVAVGLSNSADQLNSLKEKLKRNGQNVVIKHFQVQQQAFKIAGQGSEESARILQSINNYFKTTDSTNKEEILNLLLKELESNVPYELQNFKNIIKKIKNTPPGSEERKVIDLVGFYEFEYNLKLMSQKAKNL